MSLIELIAGVEAREATLTVFNADPDVPEELREHFADRNVRIVAEQTEHGPDGFAVLSREDAFVTAATVAELLPGRDGGSGDSAVADVDGHDPPDGGGDTDGDGDSDDSDGGGGSDGDNGTDRLVGEAVLDHLDETMFTSYSREEMIAASREIEDRAWRIGDGELHAGFQTLDVLAGETETYDRLGGLDGLDVHAYAAADGDPPDVDSYAIHTGRTSEIRETWFVAYDGGGYDEAKCALLAEERASGEFYGFWSYDPDTVDYIIAYLTDRYWSAERDEDGAEN
ncbi:histidine kinase [Halorubrum sp. CBA1125]|uniref:DICT sensory domain-containing protein n=1 Tax=Halorubrum sp. CBA1125 TaxID=2668072 RepID=UPI0012E7E8DD|nr:DICT sensory domain-containing protein [Halorubrum sp. CBA1125]MUW15659.1 histidine kinase [Halorubrum sp. CBA1125]